MHLGRGQPHFVGVTIAGRGDPVQDVTQLGLFVEQAQQGLAARAPRAYAEYVFRRRVESDNEQAGIEQDDARAEGIENVLRILAGAAVPARALATAGCGL
jgi:hypothetical protein